MSSQANTTAVTTFQNNLELMLQQEMPRLWDLIPQSQVSGEKCELKDLVGQVKSQKALDRHGDTRYGDTPHDRVWLAKPVADYYADLADRQDQVAALIALDSAYMKTARTTINRAKDDAVLAGIYGSIITGKDGTTLSAFPSGMQVPVTTGGASGAQRMNADKVRAARKMLAQNFNDMQEKRYMVLSAEQIDDLLKEVPVTSDDFKQLGGRVDPDSGRLLGFLGFTFIEMELNNPLLWNTGLTVDGSGYRKNPFWVESGLARGAWVDLYTDISPLPQKRMSKQIYAECIVAATRTQAGKVGFILNSEA